MGEEPESGGALCGVQRSRFAWNALVIVERPSRTERNGQGNKMLSDLGIDRDDL